MLKSRLHILGFLFFISIGSHAVCAQSLNLNPTLSKMHITGTSNLHDWRAEANSLSGTCNFTLDSDKNLAINKLTLTVEVLGLKGEKDGMTKNIRKALIYDKFKTIVYQFETLIKITPKNADTFALETSGMLTIAGVSKQISLNFDFQILKNNIHLKGTKNLKMSDYNIMPPKALLGLLKTNDTITVYFDMTYQ